MAQREIIKIDEEKCDGCGLCVTGCAEGALQVIDGKARLISDVYCDGLGACLEECPRGALEIITREAVGFDEEAVNEHLARQKKAATLQPLPANLPCGCPSTEVRELEPAALPDGPQTEVPSALRNWPIQLQLVPVQAPFFQDARLLIAADCTGFSLTGLHRDFLKDRALIVACPKLDQIGPYEEKLARIFRENPIKDISVLYMTVPCCRGLVHLVKTALENSGKSIPVHLFQIDPSGEVVEERHIEAA